MCSCGLQAPIVSATVRVSLLSTTVTVRRATGGAEAPTPPPSANRTWRCSSGPRRRLALSNALPLFCNQRATQVWQEGVWAVARHQQHLTARLTCDICAVIAHYAYLNKSINKILSYRGNVEKADNFYCIATPHAVFGSRTRTVVLIPGTIRITQSNTIS